MTSIPEPTDENTGLPPLDQPDPADTMYVAAFHHGELVLQSPFDPKQLSSTVLLSVRGVVEGKDRQLEWAQFHLAFPEDTARSVRDRLDKWLRGEL